MSEVFSIEDIVRQAQKIAIKISEIIAKEKQAIVFFYGDLGAGKTTLIREILYQLGLDRSIPVLSPTFTYIQEYQLSKMLIAHMDLYRLNDHTDIFEQGILDDQMNYDAIFIEWPERLKPGLISTNLNIKLSYIDTQTRQICLK